MADAKAGNGRVLPQFLVLLIELGLDAVLGDLDDDLLRRRPGILDPDLILIFFFGLLGLFSDGGFRFHFVFGHDIPRHWQNAGATPAPARDLHGTWSRRKCKLP